MAFDPGEHLKLYLKFLKEKFSMPVWGEQLALFEIDGN